MKRFEKITSYERLVSLYKTNDNVVKYTISAEDYASLEEGEIIIIGHLDYKNIFAEIKSLTCYPRKIYTSNKNIKLEYGMTLKLLIDVKIELLTPNLRQKGDK